MVSLKGFQTLYKPTRRRSINQRSSCPFEGSRVSLNVNHPSRGILRCIPWSGIVPIDLTVCMLDVEGEETKPGGMSRR